MMSIFKFTDGPSWDVNWGDEEPDGTLDPQGIGNDIPIGGTAGVYFLKCILIHCPIVLNLLP